MVEEVNDGDNSIDLENTNQDKRAIHVHGGMEHNMVRYAKYYSYRSTKILGGNEFIRETDYNIRDFFKH